MITLRLNINEVNDIHKALTDTSVFVEEEDVSRIANLLKKLEEQAEKDVSSWDGYVTNEVNSVLELLLPESESGNIGIHYKKAVLETLENGEVSAYDEENAEGVDIHILLDFNGTVKIK